MLGTDRGTQTVFKLAIIMSALIFLALQVCFSNVILSDASDDAGEAQLARILSTNIDRGSVWRSNGLHEEYIKVSYRKSSGVNVAKFEVEYSKKSIPVLDVRVQTTDPRRYKFDDLHFSFDYEFRVRAFNRMGVGQWGPTKRYIAEIGRLGAPRNVKVTELTPTTYEVTLDPPTAGSAEYPIHSYRIFSSYRASSSMRVWNRTVMPADTRNVILNVGDPSKPFVVKAQARELDGRYGNLSFAVVPGQDYLDRPGAPLNFFVSKTTGTRITVVWEHPTHWLTNDLSTYVLDYRQSDGRGTWYTILLPADRTEFVANSLRLDTHYNFKLTSKFLGEKVGEVSLDTTTRQQDVNIE